MINKLPKTYSEFLSLIKKNIIILLISSFLGFLFSLTYVLTNDSEYQVSTQIMLGKFDNSFIISPKEFIENVFLGGFIDTNLSEKDEDIKKCILDKNNTEIVKFSMNKRSQNWIDLTVISNSKERALQCALIVIKKISYYENFYSKKEISKLEQGLQNLIVRIEENKKYLLGLKVQYQSSLELQNSFEVLKDLRRMEDEYNILLRSSVSYLPFWYTDFVFENVGLLKKFIRILLGTTFGFLIGILLLLFRSYPR